MKEVMKKFILHLLAPHLPRDFLATKEKVEEMERQFSNTEDLDDRTSNLMKRIFWDDEGMTLEDKYAAKMKRKEKIKDKIKIGRGLEVDRSALEEKKDEVVPTIELTKGLSKIGGTYDHAAT
jgi:hypothetical protein